MTVFFLFNPFFSQLSLDAEKDGFRNVTPKDIDLALKRMQKYSVCLVSSPDLEPPALCRQAFA